MDFAWVVVLPPLLAIALAAVTRKVYSSLFAGILLGWIILKDGDIFAGLAATLESLVGVFADAGNTKVILFCILIGGLIALLQKSGGVSGFVMWLDRRNLIRGRRSAQLVAYFVGLAIFVETSINCLIIGTLSRPVFDQRRISREKLAYICDSTSAPVNVLIPLNAWGAFITGLLLKEKLEAPLGTLVTAVGFNFYAIGTLLLVLTIIITGRDFGPMKRAERRVRETGQLLRPGARPLVGDEITRLEPSPGISPSALDFIVPVLTLVGSTVLYLVITGNGNMAKGSGTTAVFWAVLTSLTVATVLYAIRKKLPARESVDTSFKGMAALMPLALLMAMAFAIGDVTRELGTGTYLASVVSQNTHPAIVPAMLFLISAIASFSTGTSWGTFAIMIPLAVPLAGALHLHLPLVIGAVLGGGVFGDHCSPISDTTIVSSMSAACDHIDHVNTQLPYALLTATAAFALYLAAGFLV